uniref:Ribosomal protein S16 n=1 Tax=Thuja plicata TaxID=3316 RepID=A0A499PGQ0_THUPL|nr:ribosomal protein S16 [Thuja plicata]ASO66677.1 ribosomal protein S16 [Thuja plicata]
MIKIRLKRCRKKKLVT